MSLTIDKHADDNGILTSWERKAAEKKELRELKRRRYENRRKAKSVQDTNQKAA